MNSPILMAEVIVDMPEGLWMVLPLVAFLVEVESERVLNSSSRLASIHVADYQSVPP